MSWDGWTDNLAAQNIYHCGIFGLDGNPWSVKNLPATQPEMKRIEEVINNQDNSVFGTGVSVMNMKWTVLRLEPNVLVIKGKDDKAKTMVISRTKQALIVGCNKDESCQGNTVRVGVETIASELEKAGY